MVVAKPALRHRGAAKPALRRRVWFWVFLIVTILGTSFLIGSGGKDVPQPYDIDSVKPDGTKAMVLLSRELGAKFEKSAAGPTKGTALILRDDLNVEETKRLEQWITNGGTLVIADLNSSFSTKVKLATARGVPARELAANCSDPLAAGVTTIEPEKDRLYTPIKPALSAVEVSHPCFPTKDGYFAIEQDTGLGRTVVVANAAIFTNEQLGKVDNSVLVANLLDARDGQTVTLMHTDQVGGSGTADPISLIPHRARNVIWQLGIAGLLLIVWRWRRFGKPVEEPQPVEIPASSLVDGVGSLMQAGGREERASAILRNDLRRTLAERFGLPPDVEVDVLTEVTARYTKIDPVRVRAVLTGAAQGDQGLVRLAQQVEHIRQKV